eukprot:5167250-Ditylum_brightwellii.AAC.1
MEKGPVKVNGSEGCPKSRKWIIEEREDTVEGKEVEEERTLKLPPHLQAHGSGHNDSKEEK